MKEAGPEGWEEFYMGPDGAALADCEHWFARMER